MSLVVFWVIDKKGAWTCLACVLGALTSFLIGHIVMNLATSANFRCAYKAIKSLKQAFRITF